MPQKQRALFSEAAVILRVPRIPIKRIAELRKPSRSYGSVQQELSGKTPLTPETLETILMMSGGDAELVANVKSAAARAFVEENPHRPASHAFRELRPWEVRR